MTAFGTTGGFGTSSPDAEAASVERAWSKAEGPTHEIVVGAALIDGTWYPANPVALGRGYAAPHRGRDAARLPVREGTFCVAKCAGGVLPTDDLVYVRPMEA
jgi:hypothetical protein